MRRGGLAAVVLVSTGVVVCVVAHWCLGTPGSTAGRKPSLRAIPALDLPRPAATPGVALPEFRWEARALEAARMYFPDAMMVYEVVPSMPNRDTAWNVAQRAGVTLPLERYAALPETDQSGYYYYLTDGAVAVTCFPDGNYGVEWRDRSPVHPLPERVILALGVDETAALAEQFVADTPGLLPAAARLTQVVPKLVRHHWNSETRVEEAQILTRAAVYRRFRDGFPEGRFSVEINGDGQVCSIHRNMRDVRPIGRYPILSPTEAAAALYSDAARVEGLSAADAFYEVALIEKAEMEYYDGALGWRMDTIQPIYRFTGTARDAGGRTTEFHALVPAVRPEYTLPVEMPRPGGAAVKPGAGDAGAP